MSNWTFNDLKSWDDKICQIASNYGLDWHPINYEICDYYEMIGHMSYHGMPSHYQHWSYGKSFERTHQMYNLGVEGLPYELIINSNPSTSNRISNKIRGIDLVLSTLKSVFPCQLIPILGGLISDNFFFHLEKILLFFLI